MIYRTTIVFRAKIKWYKPKKVKKMALKSWLLTVQILTNDVQVLILCLSYLLLYYFCTYLNIYTIFARTHIFWLDFFLLNLIINSNQILFRGAGFEVAQIPWLFAKRKNPVVVICVLNFCHLLYPNGIVAVSFFKLLLSLHIGGCHRNGRALCFS